MPLVWSLSKNLVTIKVFVSQLLLLARYAILILHEGFIFYFIKF